MTQVAAEDNRTRSRSAHTPVRAVQSAFEDARKIENIRTSAMSKCDLSSEEDGNLVVNQAYKIYERLEAGSCLMEEAIAALDSHELAFGIGSCLYHLQKANLMVSDSMFAIFEFCVFYTDHLKETGERASRWRMVLEGQKQGYIVQTKSLRDAMPESSVQTTKSMIQSYCLHMDVPMAELLSKKRARHLVKARGYLIFILRAYFGQTLAFIGRYLGNRDHTTILYAYEKACRTVKNDVKERLTIEEIANILDAGGIYLQVHLLQEKYRSRRQATRS
mgnify:CR=1 FL=1